jgi:predicted small integral membrane protein
MKIKTKTKKIRLSIKTLLVLIVLCVFISISSFSQIWDYNKFYSSTSHIYFQNARQPHEKINFNNVNEELLAASVFFYTNKIRIANKLRPFKYSRFLQLASYSQAN